MGTALRVPTIVRHVFRRLATGMPDGECKFCKTWTKNVAFSHADEVCPKRDRRKRTSDRRKAAA